MTAVTGGGEIRLAPYEPFGSEELAQAIVETLDGRLACLMANHGQIAVAPTLDFAMMVATEVEEQAAVYHGTLAIGGAKILSDAQIDDVMQRFAGYGQKKEG
jgi:L-fuculose-phosphate aldolase